MFDLTTDELWAVQESLKATLTRYAALDGTNRSNLLTFKREKIQSAYDKIAEVIKSRITVSDKGIDSVGNDKVTSDGD